MGNFISRSCARDFQAKFVSVTPGNIVYFNSHEIKKPYFILSPLSNIYRNIQNYDPKKLGSKIRNISREKKKREKYNFVFEKSTFQKISWKNFHQNLVDFFSLVK